MRSLFMLISLVLGVLIPQGEIFEPAIRYFLAGMLFFSFLNINISTSSLHISHLWITILNLTSATIAFLLLRDYNYGLATAVFLMLFSPTAIAAAGVAVWIKADLTYVAISVIITNMTVVILVPFVIPYLLQSRGTVSVLGMLPALAIIFFIPFGLARSIKTFAPKILAVLNKVKELSFIFFVVNIYIASARAVTFIRFEADIPVSDILLATGSSGLIGILVFTIGYFLGGKKFAKASMLATGQKNTMFSIWIALTYISPYAALAPISYILWQNIIISFIIKRFSVKEVA